MSLSRKDPNGIFETPVREERLRELLEREYYRGRKIADFSIERIGSGEGSFSRIGIATITLDTGSTAQVVVKIASCLSYLENRKRRGWSSASVPRDIEEFVHYVHNKECMFYNDIFSAYIPQVYAIERYGLNGSGLIVMSYRPEAKTSNVYENYIDGQVEKIIEGLINVQESAMMTHSSVTTLDEMFGKSVFENLKETTLSEKNLRARFIKMSDWDEKLKGGLEELNTHLHTILKYDIADRSENKFLVHGDLYCNNQLFEGSYFRYFIDFQMVHFGDPAEDCIRLFCMCLSAQDRMTDTKRYLKMYTDGINKSEYLRMSENLITYEQVCDSFVQLFPMCGLWALVSLHASFENCTQGKKQDADYKLQKDTVVKKMLGIVDDINNGISFD